MTTISPTSVSMYDFLYQDTQPIVPLLADTAALSLSQARLATTASLQAIVSALLAYHQRHNGQAVNKKLFGRSAIKELRQYNSMNFETIKATLYHRHDIADAIFLDNATIEKACTTIATQIDSTNIKVNTLLTSLCALVVRELAILTEYSQLDSEELDKWFALQPQFLTAARFNQIDNTENNKNSVPVDSTLLNSQVSKASGNLRSIPPFNTYWYQISGFDSTQITPVQDMQQATSNYLKAIGRSAENTQRDQHDDMLMFEPMPAIALPHQRWLLQLAKISDIYLSRNRLRITSEPISAPTPPFVSLALLGGHEGGATATTKEKSTRFDKPYPLWKNPVIWITLLVIAILGALAMIKYQAKQSALNTSTSKAVTIKNKANVIQQEVAIVEVNKDADH
ncbi:hypothetical protein [Psychrobacter sp. DM4]|uniref:hypothetical protein n=1 Tax=Psychrobacter sp. DM4 TaxID=3440637 RepID=UPI003F4F6243